LRSKVRKEKNISGIQSAAMHAGKPLVFKRLKGKCRPRLCKKKKRGSVIAGGRGKELSDQWWEKGELDAVSI